MACEEEPEEKPCPGSPGVGAAAALEPKPKARKPGKSNWASVNEKRKAERLVALKLQKGQPVKRLLGKQPLMPSPRREIQYAVRIEVQRKFVSQGTQTD